MSNHRPANDPGASVASIATGATLTLAALGAALYVLWGPMDPRGLTGAGLGLVLAIVLMAQTAARIADRMAAAERIRRHQARQRTEHVAVMDRPLVARPEDTAVVRFPQEETGPPPVPVSPGWATDETQVFRSPLDVVGEETRRLDPGVYRSGPPSAAALTPIQVPVFRTEAERTSWADRHNLPTEVVPFQPYPEGWPDQS